MADDEEVNDVRKLLNKLPKSHAQLVNGFKWKFQSGNTLHGDDEHVGYMDDQNKEIAVAAPWNYGREFTILHEIAHRVWGSILTPEIKKEWKQIVKNTSKKQDQGAEELFCMAYAATYCKNPPTIHDHETWKNFIHKLQH